MTEGIVTEERRRGGNVGRRREVETKFALTFTQHFSS